MNKETKQKLINAGLNIQDVENMCLANNEPSNTLLHLDSETYWQLFEEASQLAMGSNIQQSEANGIVRVLKLLKDNINE